MTREELTEQFHIDHDGLWNIYECCVQILGRTVTSEIICRHEPRNPDFRIYAEMIYKAMRLRCGVENA